MRTLAVAAVVLALPIDMACADDVDDGFKAGANIAHGAISISVSRHNAGSVGSSFSGGGSSSGWVPPAVGAAAYKPQPVCTLGPQTPLSILSAAISTTTATSLLSTYKCTTPTNPTNPNQANPTQAAIAAIPETINHWAKTANLKNPQVSRQPNTKKVLPATPPVIAYTNATVQHQNLKVGPLNVTITARPTKYTWAWGDNTTTQTHTPGAAYPNQTITHEYAPAKKRQITLTTTWEIYYQAPGLPSAKLNQNLQTTSQSTPFEVTNTTTVLTNDAEKEQGH
ncbi:hypothetical protein [Winkia neuii]|nr:hypothetical protein [Winkia neuii]